MEAAHEGGDRLERILEAFSERLARTSPYRIDRELAQELSVEARPAISSLLVVADCDASDRIGVLDHHEGLALVTLLGRRAGVLGATPTAAVSIVPALFDSFAFAGAELPSDLQHDLATLCVEGYVAGREEHLVERHETALADAQCAATIAQGCALLTLAGDLSAEALEQAVDRFGRRMLKADTKAAVVDMSRLERPAPDRAAEVFGADAAARMLGARCIFTGVTDAWLDAAREGRVSIDLLTVEPNLDAALAHALRLAGWELRRVSSIPGAFRALLRR